MKKVVTLAAVVCILVLAACAGSVSTQSSMVQSSSVSPTPTNSNTVTTAGQLATAGQAIYTTRCASCHGSPGRGVTGPALIGESAGLSKYGTGQGLYTYISANMPFNAPASLSAENYLDVTAFLVVQNNYIGTDTPLSAITLGNVTLAH